MGSRLAICPCPSASTLFRPVLCVRRLTEPRLHQQAFLPSGFRGSARCWHRRRLRGQETHEVSARGGGLSPTTELQGPQETAVRYGPPPIQQRYEEQRVTGIWPGCWQKPALLPAAGWGWGGVIVMAYISQPPPAPTTLHTEH